MENYTDNSNDRPYDKNTGTGQEIKKQRNQSRLRILDKNEQ